MSHSVICNDLIRLSEIVQAVEGSTNSQTHLFYTRHSNTEPGNRNHMISGKEKVKVWLSCRVFVSLYSSSKMAEARFSQDEFSCAVCLDLLKDPVTIHCGHSYCKSCITDCWDQEDQMRVYSCPQCRQTFSPRPALARNTMLAEVVEKLKKTKLSADCYAGAGDVQCDVCTGRKYKAVKSCLMCQESYCQTHFERHEEFHSRKPHKVTEATGRLQEMICQKHEKILEVFCRTDQKCICVLCSIIEHKNHDIVSAAEQRTENQVFNTRHWWNIADIETCINNLL